MTTFRLSIAAFVLALSALAGSAYSLWYTPEPRRDACARLTDLAKAVDGLQSADGKPSIVGLMGSNSPAKSNLLIDCLTE